MPAMANIVINDGKSTPVAHTFAPVTTDGSAASLANRAASIPRGFELLGVEVRKPQSATGSYRVQVDMTLPVVAAVDGTDQVVKTSKASLVLNISQDSTTAERKDMRVLLANALQNALITSVIENLEPIY
jgi:hypothetical protein